MNDPTNTGPNTADAFEHARQSERHDRRLIAKRALSRLAGLVVNADAGKIARDALAAIGTNETETHEDIEIALKALRRLACWGNGDRYGNSHGNVIAQEAIKDIEAETARRNPPLISQAAVEAAFPNALSAEAAQAYHDPGTPLPVAPPPARIEPDFFCSGCNGNGILNAEAMLTDAPAVVPCPLCYQPGPAAEHKPSFRSELEHLINRYSLENGSDTPDFILAEFLADCLAGYDKALTARAAWYSSSPDPKER